MIVNCVACRGHYLVIGCDIFIFPSSGSVTHGHFLVIHRLWTVCGLDPFSVPRTENLTPQIWPRTYLSAPRLLLPGTGLLQTSVQSHGCTILSCDACKKLPFLVLCPTRGDLEGRRATQKWLLSGLCISVSSEDVLSFDPTKPPFPLAHLGLKRQCDAE